MGMAERIHRIGHNWWLLCGFVVWLIAFGGARIVAMPAQATPPPAKNSPPPQNPPQQAHGRQRRDVRRRERRASRVTTTRSRATSGARIIAPSTRGRRRAKQGCESCHGPGSKHVDDPVANPVKRFSKLPPTEVNATCTTCHNRGEHALWEGSQHESARPGLRDLPQRARAEVSEPKQLKAATQLELCATCHRDKVAKLDRSGHMPVREGKMQCSTCHNPHGATNVRLLRKGDSIAELCTSCHADKRGPYLWEHAPSRDGCTTCHDPHGSSNERMLVAKPPILCQRCHVATRHPSTIYDAALVGAGATPSVRIYARSCVTCHSAIHGSNHPSGQRFIR